MSLTTDTHQQQKQQQQQPQGQQQQQQQQQQREAGAATAAAAATRKQKPAMLARPTKAAATAIPGAEAASSTYIDAVTIPSNTLRFVRIII